MNNIKLIREIAGVSQEEIAKVLGCNRVTISNWENDNSKPSLANREKMSIYFGVGPEYFYDKEIGDMEKRMIIDVADRKRNAQNATLVEPSEKFGQMMDSVTFSEALQQYASFFKVMLAKAEDVDLETLELAYQVSLKLGNRLGALVEIRKQEEDEVNGSGSLKEILDNISTR